MFCCNRLNSADFKSAGSRNAEEETGDGQIDMSDNTKNCGKLRSALPFNQKRAILFRYGPMMTSRISAIDAEKTGMTGRGALPPLF